MLDYRRPGGQSFLTLNMTCLKPTIFISIVPVGNCLYKYLLKLLFVLIDFNTRCQESCFYLPPVIISKSSRSTKPSSPKKPSTKVQETKRRQRPHHCKDGAGGGWTYGGPMERHECFHGGKMVELKCLSFPSQKHGGCPCLGKPKIGTSNI